eukprot:EG_transcript_11442
MSAMQAIAMHPTPVPSWGPSGHRGDGLGSGPHHTNHATHMVPPYARAALPLGCTIPLSNGLGLHGMAGMAGAMRAPPAPLPPSSPLLQPKGLTPELRESLAKASSAAHLSRKAFGGGRTPFRTNAPVELRVPPTDPRATAAGREVGTPGLKPNSAPCTPLLWDISASHASLPSSPLRTWGDVSSSPGLSSTPTGSPLLWDGETDPRRNRIATAAIKHPSVFEVERDYCSKMVDSLFAGDDVWTPPPGGLPTLPADVPAPPPPRQTSMFAFATPDEAAPLLPAGRSAESPASPPGAEPVLAAEPVAAAEAAGAAAGLLEDAAGQVAEGTRCVHRKSWKRLRAKKGCAFFVCFQCGAKWRMKAKEAE